MEKIRRSTKELGEMCCGFLRTSGGIMGVILLLTGGLQIGIGLFFMLNIPGFVVASNIWTGVATGVAGVSLMYFAYTNNSRRRKNCSFLVLNIIGLLVNVLNVVVIQVGEKSKFLTQERLEILEQDSDAKFVFDLAIIASTIVSSIVLVITFGVSQFLFCGHLMKPKFRHQIAIIEPSERAKENDVKGSRFFPPSRLVAKEKIQPLPPFEDVLVFREGKTEVNNQCWVYKTEDKISQSLYPLGFENHPQGNDPANRLPVRHSSFLSPRYARVRHRPQRAHSFGNSRNPFSLHGDKNSLRPLPVSIPRLHDISLSNQRIRKSNSFAFQTTDGTITLSKKYHCFTQNRDVNFSVIEVGSLKSISPENSLHFPVTNFPTDVNQEHSPSQFKSLTLPRPSKQEWNSQENSFCKSNSFHKLPKNKGPAPLPPTGNTTSVSGHTIKEEIFISKANTIHKQQAIEEEIETDSRSDRDSSPKGCRELFENEREMEENSIATMSFENKNENHVINEENLDICDSKSKTEIKNIPTGKESTPNCNLKTLNNEISSKNKIIIQNSKSENTYCLKSVNIKTKENSFSISEDKIDDTLVQVTKDTELLNENLQIHSKYETVHREILADTKPLLDQIPTGELQKNKIVLRVPSFKTTGCQTDVYRPLRRRASCSQGNVSINPRYLPSKDIQSLSHHIERRKHNMHRVLNVGSSSSSGYSSPEGGSKNTSPLHSGPPSPCSSYEKMTNEKSNKSTSGKPNITVIEITKIEKLPFDDCELPSNHPHFISHSISHKSIDQTINEHPNCARCVDLDEETDVICYAEAINPMVVRLPDDNGRIPRIIDAIYKPSHISNSLNGSYLQSINDFHSEENFNFNNLSNREPTYTRSSPSLLETQRFQVPSISNSTLAYITSLERLATHYRDKALENAKQLEIQQFTLGQESFQEVHQSLAQKTTEKF